MEYIKIENGIIVAHIAGDRPDETYTQLNGEFWGAVGEPVDWYDEHWNRIDDITLYKSGKKQLPEGWKINNDETDIIEMEYDEKIIAGVIPLPPNMKIDGDKIVPKTNKELFDDGILSLEDYKEIKRNERNRLLSETDKYMLPDFPISDENREIVREYRLLLRDITENENWYESELPRLELKTNL